MSKRTVYLDNAATTKPYPEVVEAVAKCLTEDWYNPGGNYEAGDDVKNLIASTRLKLARIFNCLPDEIYFTSGGTEADNEAIRGVVERFKSGHIITTAIEHKAILNACKWAEIKGFDVTYLQPDERGYISPQQVEEAIRDDTVLVSIGMVNNEVGTIQPISEIVKTVSHFGTRSNLLIHTDAVQAIGHLCIDLHGTGIDMMSVSGHKFHAPKGVGFLYIRHGVDLPPLILGGGQERGFRSGTENVPGIVGMGVAAELCYKRFDDTHARVQSLRDHMIERILNEIPGSHLNGSLVVRSDNNVNVRFDKVNGEALLALMNLNGIYASTGSACSSHDGKPSHVLTAMGLMPSDVRSSIRFTLGEDTTIEDVDYTVDSLCEFIAQLT